MQTESYEVKLQQFLRLLHRQPIPSDTRQHPRYQGRYLPVSFIEMKLDELYFGLWETTHFEYHITGGEISARIDLRVFHPIAKLWITRTGVAAVPVQVYGKPDLAKIVKAFPVPMEKALPQLKAECIKNAARSLGKLFGRDLNREGEQAYKPIVHS